MWFFPGVSGTGDFVMLDDVYDYTMIYITGERGGGLLKVGWVGWSAGYWSRVRVWHIGLWKMGSRMTPYLGM